MKGQNGLHQCGFSCPVIPEDAEIVPFSHSEIKSLCHHLILIAEGQVLTYNEIFQFSASLSTSTFLFIRSMYVTPARPSLLDTL